LTNIIISPMVVPSCAGVGYSPRFGTSAHFPLSAPIVWNDLPPQIKDSNCR